MDNEIPTLRLHLWLETGHGLYFGMGRALLLAKVERYGSLRRAAEDLGMSYRAAWGKIKKTEELLGFRLITPSGSKREGCQLTQEGKALMDKYLRWFREVEKEALQMAQELFPWPVRSYGDKRQE